MHKCVIDRNKICVLTLSCRCSGVSSKKSKI